MFTLYANYIKLHLKKAIEYRYSFFMGIFVQIVTYITMYLGIWIMLDKFKMIGTWTYWEAVFLYSINLCSYGISGLFFWQPMRFLEHQVNTGEFDLYLVKPVNPLFHLVCRQFEHAFFGQISISIFMLVLCCINLSVTFTLARLGLLVLVIFSAFLIQSAFFILGGSLSFWFVKSGAFVDTFIYGFRRFIDYPVSVYNKAIQIILTFIIPYAFVNFYPAVYFLNKKSEILFSRAFLFLTPAVGIFMFALALLVWNAGIRKYNSSGS